MRVERHRGRVEGAAHFRQKSKVSAVPNVRRLLKNSGTGRLLAGAGKLTCTSGSADLDSPRWTTKAAKPSTWEALRLGP